MRPPMLASIESACVMPARAAVSSSAVDAAEAYSNDMLA